MSKNPVFKVGFWFQPSLDCLNVWGEVEKLITVKWRSYFRVGFVVASHGEPKQVCRTSQSVVLRLWSRLQPVWSVRERDMGNKVFRRSLREGFLKSRLEMKQRSALSKLFSQWCFFPSPCLLLHRSTFSSPQSLCLSAVCCVAYPALLTLFLFMWCFCFIVPLHPVEASRLMHHSRLPPCGTDAGKVRRTAIERISVLSDTDARGRAFSLSESQNCGDGDCGSTSVSIKNGFPPMERRTFFLFASHKAE